jgi:hypothetical protein
VVLKVPCLPSAAARLHTAETLLDAFESEH